jgi:hypothetical protein
MVQGDDGIRNLFKIFKFHTEQGQVREGESTHSNLLQLSIEGYKFGKNAIRIMNCTNVMSLLSLIAIDSSVLRIKV